MSLDLRNRTDPEGPPDLDQSIMAVSATETTGSYHTANSNCSQLMSHSMTNFLPSEEEDWKENFGPSEDKSVDSPARQHDGTEENSKMQLKVTNVMFDSGVDLMSSEGKHHPLMNPKLRSLDGGSSASSHSSSREEIGSSKHPKVFYLMERIAAQRAQIMKNLEMGCDKCVLDQQIAELQLLQKELLLLDKDGLEEVGGPKGSPIEENSEEERVSSSSIRNMGEISMDNFSRPSITYSPPFNPENVITVPNFIMRGAGKQTHYEYEIKICLYDDRWTLLRRYSRFRDLHNQMKNTFGDKIKILPFPKKTLFGSKSENVAKARRQQLEIYLKRLMNVAMKIPQCPLYESPGCPSGSSLTKHNLIEFSSFFKKGIFECGKHGTG